jgi:hypothetical protein
MISFLDAVTIGLTVTLGTILGMLIATGAMKRSILNSYHRVVSWWKTKKPPMRDWE